MGESLRTERATAAWISHDATPDQVGAAMGLCQDASASCLHTGKCTYEGECFQPQRVAITAAKACILKLARAQPQDVRQAMLLAVDLLTAQCP